MKKVKKFCLVCNKSLLGIEGRRLTCCEEHHREWLNRTWRNFWKKNKDIKPYFKRQKKRIN